MQPKPPRAPKQRSRADSDDELDAAEQKKIETMARAQASDELQREVQIMRDDSSSDDESEEDDLGLDDDGEDIDGLDFGKREALSPSQSALVDSFLNPGGRTRTLADLIMEKIAEKEAAQHGDDDEDDDDQLPDKVWRPTRAWCPRCAGSAAANYRKWFKVIPALGRWGRSSG